MASANAPDDHGGPGTSRRRRSNDPGDEDEASYRQRRKPPQPPAKTGSVTAALGRPPSPLGRPPSPHRRPPSPRKRRQPPRPPSPPSPPMEAAAYPETAAEKSKRLLEWELSTLEASDLRSHAWYHGDRVDRREAERLLRQYAAAEEQQRTGGGGGGGSDAIAAAIAAAEPYSDGLEDVSSESSDGDFASDECPDELIDENGRLLDPSMATSARMAVALLAQQRRLLNAARPTARPARLNRRRRFYCFLVRDSLNVRPPGRYVLSCLRLDKFDGDGHGKKRGKQRARDQKRNRPVLHFVINEIIMQRGTVYERSQFTFGETLPKVATVTSVTINQAQEKNQPAFDSVPDLIRYYVGGADDNAVLSYGGGNEGLHLMSLHFTQTEVRIRYPCNRRHPLMTYSASNTSFAQQGGHSSPRQWMKLSSSRSPVQRFPSVTLTPITEKSFKPFSVEGLETLNQLSTSSTTLPRKSSQKYSPPLPASGSELGMLSSTLPRSLTSSRPLLAGFSSNSSSFSLLNSDPFSTSSVLSDYDAHKEMTTSLSSKPLTLIESLPSCSTSNYFENTDVCTTAMKNSMHGKYGGEENDFGAIDMDAEIAAALSTTVDDDSDGSDSVFHTSDLPEVRSSFSWDDTNKGFFSRKQLDKMDFDSYSNLERSHDSYNYGYDNELKLEPLSSFSKTGTIMRKPKGVQEMCQVYDKFNSQTNNDDWEFNNLRNQPNSNYLRRNYEKKIIQDSTGSEGKQLLMNEKQHSDSSSSPLKNDDFNWNQWSSSSENNFIPMNKKRSALQERMRQMQAQFDELQNIHRRFDYNEKVNDISFMTSSGLKKTTQVEEMKKHSEGLSKTENTRNIVPNRHVKVADDSTGSDVVKTDNMVENWFGLHQFHQMATDEHMTNVELIHNSSKIDTSDRIVDNLTNLTAISTVNSNTNLSDSKIDKYSTGNGNIECKLTDSYENFNPMKDNPKENTIDQEISEHYKLKDKSLKTEIDYENILSPNVKVTDYENIGANINQFRKEKRQKLINTNSNSVVNSALQAVHMAIIGDPEDGAGITSVAGTGRLAAALCHADGKATVIPYLQQNSKNETEGKQSEISLESCPLQVLGQPGPEGRRARLDIIERFACLQYLVALTVVVTPCLLLIGGDGKCPSDKHLEWSLEDEYEYRRRKFYYRCAGANDDFDSDNDDKESEQDSTLRASMPSKEEWTAERRHWIDRLSKHRAVALDKWIQTAADVKQAFGDVYGYRALMSALCSDRIQSLRDAWASLRQTHTATALEFESRLRPEFLGHRDKHVVGEAVHSIDDDGGNDVDVLVQLPPNVTIPDATALAVLYEKLYSNENHDYDVTNTNISDNKKEEKHSLSLSTSPLLMLPPPWLSFESGVSGGMGAAIDTDYGLHALHVLCVQYSEWVQERGSNGSKLPVTKLPMKQLDRFRRNFRTLLRQYSEIGENDHKVYLEEKSATYHKESNDNHDYDFTYERNYEDRVEQYGIDSGVYYDSRVDEDDDDATVICCSNSSSTVAVTRDSQLSENADSVTKASSEDKHPHHHHVTQRQDKDFYYRWIKDIDAYGRNPAPIDTVFRTELHVLLFWPPTLFLQDNNDDCYVQSTVPAYAMGTTRMATIEATGSGGSNVQRPNELRHLINNQLDRAAEDMRFRYKAMDKFLDAACAYSMAAVKVAY